mmetsp:Transcript_15971/g.23925  ORF Transcript_15971/g.23925 Transcript_15971/m.23925 type:complete len:298 (+) Transcript_15971:234-1127(+)
MVTDTRHHTRNVGEEFVHKVLVSGNSNDKIVGVVLHNIEKNLDGFLSVITVISGIVEVVSLINKKDSSHGLLDHFLGLRGGMSNVLSYKVVTGGEDDMSTTGVSHLGEDLSHTYSNGGLSGSGGSSETHMEGRNGGLESKLTTHLIKNQKGSNLLNTRLDGNKSNKVVVKFVKLILNSLFEHKFINGTSGLGIRHVVHVINLLLTLLTTDLVGTLTLIGLLSGLTTLGIGFLKGIGKLNVVSVVRVGTSSVFKRWSGERVGTVNGSGTSNSGCRSKCRGRSQKKGGDGGSKLHDVFY